jgi:hypothetical protein
MGDSAKQNIYFINDTFFYPSASGPVAQNKISHYGVKSILALSPSVSYM